MPSVPIPPASRPGGCHRGFRSAMPACLVLFPPRSASGVQRAPRFCHPGLKREMPIGGTATDLPGSGSGWKSCLAPAIPAPQAKVTLCIITAQRVASGMRRQKAEKLCHGYRANNNNRQRSYQGRLRPTTIHIPADPEPGSGYPRTVTVPVWCPEPVAAPT